MSGRQFTFVSLIVCVVILVIGVGLFLVWRAKKIQEEQAVACMSNIHNLTGAFFSFALDHDGHLPGSAGTSHDSNPDHGDWLLGGNALKSDQIARLPFAPESGSLWKYVGKDDLYRCPSLAPGTPGSGVGSNGRFDYSVFPEFCGAGVADIKPMCELHFGNGPAQTFPTPLVSQEDVAFSINSTGIDGQHVSADRFSHIHRGGSYYGAMDGSVTFINEPPGSSWFMKGPISGNLVRIGNSDPGEWNWWAHQ